MKYKFLIFILFVQFGFCFMGNAQNNLFEKAFQSDFRDLFPKYLKRDSSGFAVFTNSKPGQFDNPDYLFSCNDTGLILQVNNISSFFPNLDGFDVGNWYETPDGNYIMLIRELFCHSSNFPGNYAVNGDSKIVCTTPSGTLIWSTPEIHPWNFGQYVGLLKYQIGYLYYSLDIGLGIGDLPIPIKFCDEFGNTRDLPSMINNYYKEIYSNGQNLYALDNYNFLSLIDTSGIVYRSFNLGNILSVDHSSFDSFQNKIIFGARNGLYLLTDSLDSIQQLTTVSEIEMVQFDALGNIWALLVNGDLMAFDSSLNFINAVNLMGLTTNINSVKWFYIHNVLDRIYFGGLAMNKPFLKSMELSTYNHYENSIDAIVTSTQITNLSASVVHTRYGSSYLDPYRNFLFYEFDVGATVKNVGNTIIDNLFLNCSEQIGAEGFCYSPFLSKQFTNLNLLPGDSLFLFIGRYKDNYIGLPPGFQGNTYTREDFGVWVSSPNTSWMHTNHQPYFQDVIFPNLIGVGVNEAFALSNDLTVFPNPGSESISVFCPEDFVPEQIVIHDISGLELMKRNFSDNNLINLDISSLSNGVYFLQVNSKDKVVQKKFLKVD